MPVVKKAFAIVSANGSMMFAEGQNVAKEVAEAYPHFMEGYVGTKARVHNPNLPVKVSKSQSEKMSETSLLAWIEQYHPAEMPKEKLNKAELSALVMELQQE